MVNNIVRTFNQLVKHAQNRRKLSLIGSKGEKIGTVHVFNQPDTPLHRTAPTVCVSISRMNGGGECVNSYKVTTELKYQIIGLVWFGLWCLTPLSTIFQ